MKLSALKLMHLTLLFVMLQPDVNAATHVNKSFEWSHTPLTSTTISTHYKYQLFSNDMFSTLGIGAGYEYVLFALKGSLIKPYRFKSRYKYVTISQRFKSRHAKYGFYPFGSYVGLDFNAMGLAAAWLSIGTTIGLSFPFFTLDNSLTFSGWTGPDGGYQNGGHISWNPKLGLRIGPVWLKSGPSLILGTTTIDENWLKFNQYNLNFELSFYIDHLH